MKLSNWSGAVLAIGVAVLACGCGTGKAPGATSKPTATATHTSAASGAPTLAQVDAAMAKASSVHVSGPWRPTGRAKQLT